MFYFDNSVKQPRLKKLQKNKFRGFFLFHQIFHKLFNVSLCYLYQTMALRITQNFKVETLKLETRQRLLQNIDGRYDVLSELKVKHENEIEMVTRQIDLLHEKLEEAMKSRFLLSLFSMDNCESVELLLRIKHSI
jgi:hypothetical protein